MSEIKGQLLGIILVLILFGTASAVLIATFTKMANSVGQEVDNLTDELTGEDAIKKPHSTLLHY